jgi:sigma-B regulation protein RsbU (phosphoserine phosphatase)
LLVTIAIAVIERTTLRATVASAGHPPVLLRRVNGTVEQLLLEAPPLGVRLPFQVAEAHLALGPGDVLVLYTDGVFEARAEEEAFGMERLEQVVAEHGSGSAASLRDALLGSLAEFRAGAPLADDATIVVARMG